MIQTGCMSVLPLWLGKFTFEQAWEWVPCARCTAANYAVVHARTFLPKVLGRLLGTLCSSLKKWGLLSRMTMVAEGLRRKVSVSLTQSLSRQQLLRRSERH